LCLPAFFLLLVPELLLPLLLLLLLLSVMATLFSSSSSSSSIVRTLADNDMLEAAAGGGVEGPTDAEPEPINCSCLGLSTLAETEPSTAPGRGVLDRMGMPVVVPVVSLSAQPQKNTEHRVQLFIQEVHAY
jgi:hypothetical protein